MATLHILAKTQAQTQLQPRQLLLRLQEEVEQVTTPTLMSASSWRPKQLVARLWKQ